MSRHRHCAISSHKSGRRAARKKCIDNTIGPSRLSLPPLLYLQRLVKPGNLSRDFAYPRTKIGQTPVQSFPFNFIKLPPPKAFHSFSFIRSHGIELENFETLLAIGSPFVSRVLSLLSRDWTKVRRNG